MNTISSSKPHFITFAVIGLIWLKDFIQPVFFHESIMNLTKSLPTMFLTAGLVGLAYVVVVALLLRSHKEKYSDLGFSGDSIKKQFLNGLLFGTLIFILQTFLLSPLVDALLPKTASQGMDPARMFAKLVYLPILIALTVFKGGLAEELWRVFVLTRFRRAWGKTGLIFALTVSSLLFGLGHLYQGLGGVMTIAVVGFFYALVFLRKGKAWEAVIAHAWYDVVSVILGFIIYYGK
jgi:membrane protease YdiL (CAAX protease family)